MCIAAIINNPIKRAYLDEMHKDNPHGGGVAWHQDGKLHFKRGLDADAVWEMQDNGTLTFPYLLHFRWATHGEIVPELTHPFPLGMRALFGELEGTAQSVLIHNGVWNACTTWLDMVRAPAELVKATSDTGIAAYLLGKYPGIFQQKLDSIPWAIAVAKTVAGKLVIEKYGHSWTSYNGNDYSNLSWLPADEWWPANSHNSKYYTPITRRYPGAHKGWGNLEDWGNGEDFYYVPPSPRDAIKQAWGKKDKGARFEGQDFVDDFLTTKNPVRRRGAAEIIKCFDSWEEYVRARYGDEVAEAVANDGLEPELPDDEIVSEEAAVVNAYLERLERDRNLDAETIGETIGCIDSEDSEAA